MSVAAVSIWWEAIEAIEAIATGEARRLTPRGTNRKEDMVRLDRRETREGFT